MSKLFKDKKVWVSNFAMGDVFEGVITSCDAGYIDPFEDVFHNREINMECFIEIVDSKTKISYSFVAQFSNNDKHDEPIEDLILDLATKEFKKQFIFFNEY